MKRLFVFYLECYLEVRNCGGESEATRESFYEDLRWKCLFEDNACLRVQSYLNLDPVEMFLKNMSSLFVLPNVFFSKSI